MYLPVDELKKATELTRAGKLAEATDVIRRALGGLAPPAQAPVHPPVHLHLPVPARARVADDATDVAFRELPPVADSGTFEAHRFAFGGRTTTYRLYVPPRNDDRPLPVIVMLHGCTQDAADFAAGTAMNEMAAQRGCIVVYPEQLQRANSMRCWNWFEPAHQQRGRGEPALLAALVEHVVQRCNGEARQVYVAGLSAGGAMAALVAQLYPDLFAAAGVHSGLPAAAAHDVASARSAMRRPAARGARGTASAAVVPTIVFHGRADRTVHPDNGRQVIEEAAARAVAAGLALQREEQRLTVVGRTVTRTLYREPGRDAMFEHWEIAAGTHAWSGGSAAGSYTDPAGPRASAAMVDFFLAHRLAQNPRS